MSFVARPQYLLHMLQSALRGEPSVIALVDFEYALLLQRLAERGALDAAPSAPWGKSPGGQVELLAAGLDAWFNERPSVNLFCGRSTAATDSWLAGGGGGLATMAVDPLGDALVRSMIEAMGSRAGTVVDREGELREALRPAWPTAEIAPSAVGVASHVEIAALRAVAVAAATQGLLKVVRVEGFQSREDPDWYQLLLVVAAEGAPGSEGWRATLEAAGAVIEAAIERSPDLADAIASQISFDL